MCRDSEEDRAHWVTREEVQSQGGHSRRAVSSSLDRRTLSCPWRKVKAVGEFGAEERPDLASVSAVTCACCPVSGLWWKEVVAGQVDAGQDSADVVQGRVDCT